MPSLALRWHPRLLVLTSPTVALLTAHRSSAVQGRAGAVRFLLQAGADPNLADWEHRLTPLHLAAVGKQAHMRGEVVQLLLAGRARLWAEDAHGRTPLYYARQHEVEDVLTAMADAAACRLQARGRGMWVGGQLALMREASRLAGDAERRMLGPDDRDAIPRLGRRLACDAVGRHASNSGSKASAAPTTGPAHLAGVATDADKLLHAACQYMAAQGFEAGHLADPGLEAWLRSKHGAAVLAAATEEIDQLDAAASAEVLALRFRAVQLEVTTAALCATQQEAVARLHTQLVQWMPRLDATLAELAGGAASSPVEEAAGAARPCSSPNGPAARSSKRADAEPDLTVQAAHALHATERALRGKVACLALARASRSSAARGWLCARPACVSWTWQVLGADQLWPLLEPVLASAAPLRGHSISLRLADLDDDVRLTQPRLAHAADGWATACAGLEEQALRRWRDARCEATFWRAFWRWPPPAALSQVWCTPLAPLPHAWHAHARAHLHVPHMPRAD